MCLKTVQLNLTWNRHQKEYIGVGYKKVRLNAQYSDGSKKYPVNKWIKATGSFRKSIGQCSNSITATDGNSYHPGFHIFLNKEYAEKYSYGSGTVVQVQFKRVISFGANRRCVTTYDNDAKPCVVTEYMKVVPTKK